MATITPETPVTETFADLVARHSLTEGESYIFQNTGNQNIILVEGTTEPVSGGKGHIIFPGQLWPVQIETGGRVDVRTVSGKSFMAISTMVV